VSPAGDGSVVLTPAAGQYSSGATVQVTAEPDSCWKFDHWGGNLSGSTNPATITMDADKSVTAYFVEGVTIPDDQLEAALRSALNKPTGDITCSELGK